MIWVQFKCRAIVIIPTIVSILLFPQECKPLHLTKPARRAVVDCKEVLTENPVCSKPGSFPIAGACEYFARCTYEEGGLDWQVDFCPDGHIYVVNRCVRSQKNDDCPQKHCVLEPPHVQTIKQSGEDLLGTPATTLKPIFPPVIYTSNRPVTIEILRPTSLGKPVLQTLHPSTSQGMMINFYQTSYVILLTTIFATAINTFCFYNLW